MSIMELSPSDSDLVDYIKYYIDKRHNFSVFKEISFCNICVLIQRIKSLPNSEEFFKWLQLFNYKMVMSPILSRFTIFQAALLWKKCREFFRRDDPNGPIRREEIALEMISPLAFWYHFCINQCTLNSAVYTKNVERMMMVSKIGQIVEIINDTADQLYSEERSLLNMTDEESTPTIDTDVCKRSLNKLISVVTKAQRSSKKHTCLNDSVMKSYITMHDEMKQLETPECLTDAELGDFVRLCGNKYFRFSIIYDARQNHRRILEVPRINELDRVLSGKPCAETAGDMENLDAGLDECTLCNLYHFVGAYEYLENEFWRSVNQLRPLYGKMNMVLYEEFCNRVKKANKTKLEDILFNKLGVDQFYTHFVISPACRLNRYRTIFLHEGASKIHCLAAFTEILLYKLCQKLQSRGNIDVNSHQVQQLVCQINNHGLLHNTEIIWEIDGL